VVELRRLIPGITVIVMARECVRAIAAWKELPTKRGLQSRAEQQLITTDLRAKPKPGKLESYTQNADGYLLTRAAMEWFWDHYLASPGDGRNPYASPLHAPDLAGLPPTMVVTAQFDPLRDEGRAYARRLREAGVAVRESQYDDMIHGFFWMAGALDRGKELIAEMGNELRQRLAGSGVSD
jgi:acetyl esterase